MVAKNFSGVGGGTSTQPEREEAEREEAEREEAEREEAGRSDAAVTILARFATLSRFWFFRAK